LLIFFLGQYHRVQSEYISGDKVNKTYTAKMRQGYIRTRDPFSSDDTKDAQGLINEVHEKESLISESTKGEMLSTESTDPHYKKRVRIKSAWTVQTGLLSDTSRDMAQERNKRFVKNCAPSSVRDSADVSVEGQVDTTAFTFAQASMEHEYSVKAKTWRGKASEVATHRYQQHV
jgi:hypothetical protein